MKQIAYLVYLVHSDGYWQFLGSYFDARTRLAQTHRVEFIVKLKGRMVRFQDREYD